MKPQMLEFHRPQPNSGPLGRPHPGFVIIRDQIGRRTRTRRVWTSLSRSEDVVAVVIGARRVGIDVEKLQDPTQSETLMSLMHPQDQALARSRSGLERQYVVTALWTLIEAIAKLWGTGLRTDPAAIRAGFSGKSRPIKRVSTVTAGCDELGRLTTTTTAVNVHRELPSPEYVVSVAFR